MKAAALALALTIGGACASSAATIKSYDLGDRLIVDVAGFVWDTDVPAFKRTLDGLNGNPKPIVVRLSGPGGQLSGIEIGLLIRARGLATLVPNEAECSSVCALIWLAGSPRAIGGDRARIGFHAASSGHIGGPTSAAGNFAIGWYMQRLGLNNDAIRGVTTTAPQNIIWLEPRHAAEWGLTWNVLATRPAQ